jgi:hypothetical protein
MKLSRKEGFGQDSMGLGSAEVLLWRWIALSLVLINANGVENRGRKIIPMGPMKFCTTFLELLVKLFRSLFNH